MGAKQELCCLMCLLWTPGHRPVTLGTDGAVALGWGPGQPWPPWPEDSLTCSGSLQSPGARAPLPGCPRRAGNSAAGEVQTPDGAVPGPGRGLRLQQKPASLTKPSTGAQKALERELPHGDIGALAWGAADGSSALGARPGLAGSRAEGLSPVGSALCCLLPWGWAVVRSEWGWKCLCWDPGSGTDSGFGQAGVPAAWAEAEAQGGSPAG